MQDTLFLNKLVIASLCILLIACKPADSNTEKISASSNNKSAGIEIIDQAPEQHPGKKIAETKCFFCHSSDAPEHGRIAPPMIAIKAHYIDEDTSKEEFIAALQSFVDEPSIEKSKMPGAIRRFGLMPYQKFSNSDISAIGEYLYNYQIEEPEWFEQHWKNGGGRNKKPYINKGRLDQVNQNKTPADIGLEYAIGTKQVLGKNLIGTINSKGTEEALKFCNEQAYPITESKALEFNASIKRVSDKPRNPNNQANVEELNYISLFKAVVANDEIIKPIVLSDEEKHNFYYPIVTNSMCLQCHGERVNIDANVTQKINELYPDDKATGYKENQVRGIWSIQFNQAND